MNEITSDTVHATCVVIEGQGVLICGRSGSGKSDLALRLLDRGAELVSDDYTLIHRSGADVVGVAPATIVGKIEVRGIGIIECSHTESASIGLVIDLDEPPHRMPEQPEMRTFLGKPIPCVALSGLEPSAPIKVELAVRQFVTKDHQA